MPFLKKARKAVRKVGRKIRRRYPVKKHPYRAAFRMYRDIEMLKSFVNAEKKNFNISSGTNPVGQVNANFPGAYKADITPQIANGTGESNRTGDSVKLSTAVLSFQMKQQNNNTQGCRFIVELFQVLGTPQDIATAFDQLYKPNPWITGADIRDYSSLPDGDFRQQYRKILSRKMYVKPDTTGGSQQLYSTYKFPIKFGRYGQHIKYDTGTTTVASGQIIMVVRADSGNSSSTTASTLANIVTGTTSTGGSMSWSITYYYFDN